MPQEELRDPIGERGKATIIQPIKIPQFDNLANIQQNNTKLLMSLAQQKQEQAQREAALQLQRDKMLQQAAEKAEAAKVRKQASNWGIMQGLKTDPLFGDAPEIARGKLAEITSAIGDFTLRGGDINGGDAEAVKLRAMRNDYDIWYSEQAEIAKAFTEMEKVVAKDPDKYEPLNRESTISGYNLALKDGKQYMVSSPMARVGMADAVAANKHLNDLFGESSSEEVYGKVVKILPFGDKVVSKDKVYGERDVSNAEATIKMYANSSEPRLKQLYNFYAADAKAKAQFNEETGFPTAEYYKGIEKSTRPKNEGGTHIAHKPAERVSGGGSSYSSGKSNTSRGLSIQYGGGKSDRLDLEYTDKHFGGFSNAKNNYIPIAATGSFGGTWKLEDIPPNSIIDITSGKPRTLRNDEIPMLNTGAQEAFVNYFPVDNSGMPIFVNRENGEFYNPKRTSNKYKAFFTVRVSEQAKDDDGKNLFQMKEVPTSRKTPNGKPITTTEFIVNSDGQKKPVIITKQYVVPVDATEYRGKAPTLSGQDAYDLMERFAKSRGKEMPNGEQLPAVENTEGAVLDDLLKPVRKRLNDPLIPITPKEKKKPFTY